ncbi:MAG TPA: hypothetical protein VLZ84_12870, partial [Asticcacaulis sp.]|nr:hypothetical protein [Asticcacaulis sp.]
MRWPYPAAIETRWPAAPPIVTIWQGGALDNGEGPQPITGEAYQVIGAVAQIAHGTPVSRGAASQAVASISQAAIGSAVATGGAAQAVAALSQTASGSAVKTGSASQTIALLIQVLIQANIARGEAAQTVAPVTQAAAGTAVKVVSGAQVISGLAQAAQGSAVSIGAAAQAIGAVSQIASGSPVAKAQASQTIAAVTQAAAGTPVAKGSAGQAIAALAQAATATSVAQASAAQLMGGCSQSATAKPYRLWTPANLTVAPLLVFDPDTFTWSGTAFSSGANSGSIGGTYATSNGTPQRAAGDANGHDAVAFGGNSGIYLPGATTPDGNLFIFYVAKSTGSPPNGRGCIVGQLNATPGWFAFDQVNGSYAFGNGHAYTTGDKLVNFWPSGTTSSRGDVMVTPPADSGGYHISAAKVGTERYWNYDGTLLTVNYGNVNTRAGVTSDLTIGNSPAVGPYPLNADVAYLL